MRASHPSPPPPHQSTFRLLTGDLVGFSVIYSIGNVLSISATGFLIGPKRQCKLMWAAKRRITTAVYLLSISLTLVVALKTGSVAGTIVMVVLQAFALLWYTLSFIPFGQTAVLGCFKRYTGMGSSG